MKKNGISLTAVFALATSFAFGLEAASAADNRGGADHGKSGHQAQDLKVGKKGEISLSSDTKAGDLILKAGKYRMQHKFNGADHVLHFTELTRGGRYAINTGVPTAHPGEVPCELEPLGSKARHTKVVTNTKDGIARMVRVEIGGENVAHIL